MQPSDLVVDHRLRCHTSGLLYGDILFEEEPLSQRRTTHNEVLHQKVVSLKMIRLERQRRPNSTTRTIDYGQSTQVIGYDEEEDVDPALIPL
ncbi:hypothetical protein KIN20_032302 [Parelaphostrongylus tenuis]|uniref:Uncharacterized protein n=1 Tax=Parelaphostrongylus tenuis TaxID=148309 RepID=A0AAD5R8L9_PARTN|nr:hypothetical protein KIN20_032302 [Parelaphostrongylus tenuis]